MKVLMVKRDSEKVWPLAVPLVLGVASVLAFLLYWWSCNHAPYTYTPVIFAIPPLSLVGAVVSIFTRKRRNSHPALWGLGLASCLLGLLASLYALALIIGIGIAMANGDWL